MSARRRPTTDDQLQELRQKFSKVSVIHGDLSKMGQFKVPRGDRWRQRPPPDQLGRHTFVAYDISYYKVDIPQIDFPNLSHKYVFRRSSCERAPTRRSGARSGRWRS